MMFSSTPTRTDPTTMPGTRSGPPGDQLAIPGLTDLAAHLVERSWASARASRSPRTLARDAAEGARTLGTLSGVAGRGTTHDPQRSGRPAATYRLGTCAARGLAGDQGRLRHDTEQHRSGGRAPVRCGASSCAMASLCPRACERWFPCQSDSTPIRARWATRFSPSFRLLPIGGGGSRPSASQLIAAEVTRLRGSQGVAMQRIMDMGGFAPPTIMEQVQRLLLTNAGAHNLVISNVPGPEERSIFVGAPLLEVLPSGATMPRHSLNLPMLSYNGVLSSRSPPIRTSSPTEPASPRT